MDTFWTFLMQGDWLGFTHAIMSNTVGEMGYALVFTAIMGIVYGVTQNVMALAILWVLMGATLVPMVPAMGWGLLSIALYISLGLGVAWLYVRRD